jgi:hypothetical protein
MIMTIDQSGTIHMIAGHGPDLSEEGVVTQRRASHVEPTNLPLRLLFHAIRSCVRDDSQMAGWTRSWRCRWRARIFGGPTLGPYTDRAAAIAAEVEWLEANRLGEFQ